MKLYLISQDINNDYDTYDSAVVAAKSIKDAQNISPSGDFKYSNWVKSHEKEKVKVKYLGETKLKRGLILGSFNAG